MSNKQLQYQYNTIYAKLWQTRFKAVAFLISVYIAAVTSRAVQFQLDPSYSNSAISQAITECTCDSKVQIFLRWALI